MVMINIVWYFPYVVLEQSLGQGIVFYFLRHVWTYCNLPSLTITHISSIGVYLIQSPTRFYVQYKWFYRLSVADIWSCLFRHVDIRSTSKERIIRLLPTKRGLMLSLSRHRSLESERHISQKIDANVTSIYLKANFLLVFAKVRIVTSYFI